MNQLTASAAIATGRVQLASVRQRALVTAKLRVLMVAIGFVFAALTAVVRIAQLGLFEQAPDRRSLAEALLPPRGEITDRNGVPLARAFPSYSLWFNPKALGEGGNPLVKTPDGAVAAIETDERFKKIFNILADKPETVAAFFIPRMLKNKKNDRQIAWLTGGKAMWRFMTAPLRKGRLV